MPQFEFCPIWYKYQISIVGDLAPCLVTSQRHTGRRKRQVQVFHPLFTPGPSILAAFIDQTHCQARSVRRKTEQLPALTRHATYSAPLPGWPSIKKTAWYGDTLPVNTRPSGGGGKFCPQECLDSSKTGSDIDAKLQVPFPVSI